MGDAFSGCVGAVGGAEGVVDVDLAERGELLCEGGIVGFFFRVVAQVFKQQHLAGFELARQFVAISPTQSGEKATLTLSPSSLSSSSRRRSTTGRRRVLRIRLALGPAQVRGQDHLGLVPQRVFDGGQGGEDAGVVGDGLCRLR